MIEHGSIPKSTGEPSVTSVTLPQEPTPAPLARWERWFVLALFLFALGLRLVYLSQIRDNPFFEHPRLDALFHDRWAQSIAAGNIVGDQTFFRAPLYPYMLGALYAIFGHDYLIPRIVQHLLGAISVVIVFFLSRRWFGPATAVIASLLAAGYAVLIYFEGNLLFEALLAFLCLVWFLFLHRARETSTATRWFAVGVVFGLICITRPLFLALLVPLFGYEIWRMLRTHERSKAYRLALSLLLGCALPIAPVTVRNLIVGNEFVLIASQGGINFYIGNNPGADGYSSAIPEKLGASWENRDQTYYVEKQIGHRPAPGEESWFWYLKGLEFIKNQPSRFIELLVKKAYLFWNGFEIPNNHSFYSFLQYSPLLNALPIGFRIVGPLALLGMVIAWRGHKLRFVISFIALYGAAIVMFFVCDRFRVPVIPLLCIFAAYTFVWFPQHWKAHNHPTISKHLALGAVFALMVNTDVYDVARAQPERDAFSIGLVSLESGRYDEAINTFEQCTTQQGHLPNLYVSWGVAELMRGNKEKAVERFRQELQYNPQSHAALANLAYVSYANRSLDSALYYSDRAISEKPYVPIAHIYKAQAFLLMNEPRKAERVLLKGLDLCGNDFLYGEYLLAGMRLERGDLDVADSAYRSILQRSSRFRQPEYEPEFAYTSEGKMGETIERLRAKAHYGLGGILAARGRLDSCILQFRAATSIAPDLADAWSDLGVALLQTRNYPAADSALQRALQLDSTNYAYWYNYGTLLGITQQFRKAKEAFERTLRLRPDFSPAREKLAITNNQLAR